MAINYENLRSITARELLTALSRDGFYFVKRDRISVIAIRMDAV
jgi:hypothetical protein